jgi:thiol-disulfide isomerase/thioredoxin
MSIWRDLLGATLQKPDGSHVDSSDALQNKDHVFLFFGGKWCPFSIRFVPTLVNFYAKAKLRREKVEVVFVSSDHTQDKFADFYSVMPWLTIPYNDELEQTKSKVRLVVQTLAYVVSLLSVGVNPSVACRIGS